MLIKTIHYERTRKINPKLIDSRYEFGSEGYGDEAWAEVEEGETPEEAHAKLVEFVNGNVRTEIEATVFDLRAKARKRNYYWDAIEKAFFNLMSTQNMPEEEMKIAIMRFQEFLEQEMKSLEV